MISPPGETVVGDGDAADLITDHTNHFLSAVSPPAASLLGK
ncbi:hypothetical protein [Acetobacterium wieringae]|nr:hypothetical protein [Acetobacterium wieringae]